MKKLLAFAMAAVLALGLFAGCGQQNKGAELALITDIGTIDDKSFNHRSGRKKRREGDRYAGLFV